MFGLNRSLPSSLCMFDSIFDAFQMLMQCCPGFKVMVSVFVRIVFIHDSTWFWVVNYLCDTGYISLLILMCLLVCARYLKKVFDCFDSCSTLFEGHEFVSDTTHFMRYIHCLCICLVEFCAGVSIVMRVIYFHTDIALTLLSDADSWLYLLLVASLRDASGFLLS